MARALARDWEVNGILRLSTGLPYSVNTAINTLNGSGTQRASVVAGCDPAVANPGPNLWFNTACFVTPLQFQFGNAGRNVLHGPGTRQIDFSLARRISLGSRNEGRRIEFRADAFNLTNTPQFNNPINSIGAPGAGQIQSAGSPASFERISRQVQLGVRIEF